MRPKRSRRAVLEASSAVLGVAFAGCTDLLPGETETGTPVDVHTDSAGNPARYGLVVRNESSYTPNSITVLVRRSSDGETVFEDRVSGLAAKAEPQKLDYTLSKTTHQGALVEYAITAKVMMGGKEAAFGNTWVTPGAESAPAIENIRIFVRDTEDGGPMVAFDKTPDT